MLSMKDTKDKKYTKRKLITRLKIVSDALKFSNKLNNLFFQIKISFHKPSPLIQGDYNYSYDFKNR